MDFLERYGTERDVEIACLIAFVEKHPDIKSVLDVGCAKAVYAEELSKLVPRLCGVDFILDHDIHKYFKDYSVSNVLEMGKKKFDLVTAISVVEHYGIKHETGDDYEEKQCAIVKKIGELAKKYVYLTLPFGQARVFEGSHLRAGSEQLKKYLKELKGFKKTKQFFTKRLPGSEGKWTKVSERVAGDLEQPRNDLIETVCVITGERKRR